MKNYLIGILLLLCTQAATTEMNVLECENCASCCSQANKDPNEKVTILTFYIEQEADQSEDFIEMTLTILKKEHSLKKSIELVKSSLARIKETSLEYCTQYGGKKCEERVELGKHKIYPSYQTVRREPIFNGTLGFIQDSS